MYRLTLKLLMMNVQGRVPLALKVFKYLMNESYLRSSLFSLVWKEKKERRVVSEREREKEENGKRGVERVGAQGDERRR
jgi:hypothetical protein